MQKVRGPPKRQITVTTELRQNTSEQFKGEHYEIQNISVRSNQTTQ